MTPDELAKLIPEEASDACLKAVTEEGKTFKQALAAALIAWPGGFIPTKPTSWDNPEAMIANIIIPLKTETPNAK